MKYQLVDKVTGKVIKESKERLYYEDRDRAEYRTGRPIVIREVEEEN